MLKYIKQKFLDWNFRKNERDEVVSSMRKEVIKLIVDGRLEEAYALSDITDGLAKCNTLVEANEQLDTLTFKLESAAIQRLARLQNR